MWGTINVVSRPVFFVILAIPFVFSGFASLIAALKGVNSKELHTLCAINETTKEMVQAIATIENTVILSTIISNEMFISLLNSLGDQVTRIIRLPGDLLAILIQMDPLQCAHIFTVLEKKLIKNASDFCKVLEHLTPDQRTAVYENSQDRVIGWIKGSDDFRKVIEPLMSEQCTAICKSLKNQLADWITGPDDLIKALKLLASEQRQVVFKTLENNLIRMIKNNGDLIKIMSCLTPEQCLVIYNRLKEKSKLSSIIHCYSDLSALFTALTLAQRLVIGYELTESNWNAIIKPGSSEGFFNSSRNLVSLYLIMMHHLRIGILVVFQVFDTTTVGNKHCLLCQVNAWPA
jgi:hypothetical protein